ncbi:hypothetical protein G3N59_05475 [Paraburkholderia sp. Ac-20340]|uniref:hypothetical protein n=1 Tax=Paraburkholderia sp. Ac-20340 TaxID=2703888 RepID=UPI00197E1A93|nr:hypothetical protein [Paraburkholderia sp. Ac-20340]MBN3852826.1 hypothetical protein [Paraburkholderia sp. Ac-20340]
MQNIGICLMLFGPLAMLIGLIRPSTFARKGKPAPSRMKAVLVSFGVAMLGAMIFNSTLPHTPAPVKAAASNAESASSSAAVPAVAEASSAPTEPESAWSYDERHDEMTGKPIQFATASANETLDFDFPYNGGSTATLQLRKHPRFGTDVILSVSKGQFVCGVEACSVLVRFDDKPPQRFTANQPADYSSTSLFISPARSFIASARKAKRVVIEAAFYQAGNRHMTFPVAGLNWK